MNDCDFHNKITSRNSKCEKKKKKKKMTSKTFLKCYAVRIRNTSVVPYL